MQRSGRERDEWLHSELNLPSIEMARADYSSIDAREREIKLPIALKLPRYASKTGTRLFLRPNILPDRIEVPPVLETRTQPVRYFSYSFADIDSIEFELPAGYALEAILRDAF